MKRKDEHLKEVFSARAFSDGLTVSDAWFFSPKEFQASWRLKGREIEIFLSDYLIDAPDTVISDFAGALFSIVKKRTPTYGDQFMDWVTSDPFINDKRRIYMRRSKNLSGSSMGRNKEISDSVDRLLDSGLLLPSDIDNSIFTWTSRPNVRKVGYCSPMMRVVAISSALDDDSVPDKIVDYVVYHESLHLRQGYRPFKRSHDTQFRNMEKLFPEYADAEKYLKGLADKVRRDGNNAWER
jgi:hypothetical protein